MEVLSTNVVDSVEALKGTLFEDLVLTSVPGGVKGCLREACRLARGEEPGQVRILGRVHVRVVAACVVR